MNKLPPNSQIRKHASKAGVEELYDQHVESLTNLLDAATEEGQGSLAGFLFAFSTLANEIQKRHNGPKKQ